MLYRNQTQKNGNLFLMFKSRVIKHEQEHIKLRMELANMNYTVELKSFYDDNFATYQGDPGEILQQYYKNVTYQILQNDFGGKKYRQLTNKEKETFDELVNAEMENAVNVMDKVVKGKKMTGKEEEDEVQERTSFNETEWVKVVNNNKMPYTEEEAKKMNENPETAKIKEE